MPTDRGKIHLDEAQGGNKSVIIERIIKEGLSYGQQRPECAGRPASAVTPAGRGFFPIHELADNGKGPEEAGVVETGVRTVAFAVREVGSAGQGHVGSSRP